MGLFFLQFRIPRLHQMMCFPLYTGLMDLAFWVQNEALQVSDMQQHVMADFTNQQLNHPFINFMGCCSDWNQYQQKTNSLQLEENKNAVIL